MSATNSNPATRGDNEPIKLMRVAGKHCIEACDLRFKIGIGTKAKQDHPRVTAALGDHEFAEIGVIGDEDALLAFGKLKHLLIGDARRVVDGDGGRIVPERR
jgi:hypothetical protein